MLVILDRQHGDKGGTWDTGAAFGGHLAAKPDGATYWPNPPIFEVDLTTGYLAHARRHLEAAGHRVQMIDAGPYRERQQLANDSARAYRGLALYVAAHINAGGGRYGLALYDARSKMGAVAAGDVADALKEGLPELTKARATAATASGWTARALGTIRGIWFGPPNISGICFEPGFIDSPHHRSMWTEAGLRRVGRSLADGLQRYAQR